MRAYLVGAAPLVSVAVVTFNQCGFLRECIESIRSQDYPNYQIVVADDCSTDKTPELLAHYAKAEPEKFVILRAKQNRGVTANQNLALSRCVGKYVAWMAGDDLMLPGKLRTQVEFLEGNPDHAICYHDLEIFESDTGKTITTSFQVDNPRSGDLKTAVKHGAFNSAVSNMVRRECSPDSGFDERVRTASDWLYWVECLWSGGKIGYVPKILGRHRRHGNNVTSVQNISRLTEDHLISCAIILARAPWLYKEVSYREARLLRSLRNVNESEDYVNFLRASLNRHVSVKTFGAYLAGRLIGVRR